MLRLVPGVEQGAPAITLAFQHVDPVASVALYLATLARTVQLPASRQDQGLTPLDAVLDRDLVLLEPLRPQIGEKGGDALGPLNWRAACRDHCSIIAIELPQGVGITLVEGLIS